MTYSTQTMWLEEGEKMMAMWPDVVRDIKESITDLDILDVSKWMEKVLNYNVPNGKKMRGLISIYTYKSLVPNEQLLEDDVRRIHILAWCVELMQAYFIIVDDIQDRSLLRRGQPCWYRYNDIGLGAINDGLILMSAMFYLIQKYFKEKEYYVNLLETFQNIIWKTVIGQSLDLISTNFGKKPNLNLFTMDRYNSLIKYKTAYYSFLLPATAAMHMAGIKDPEIFRQAETILLEMGHLFQVQDDYLSCFADSEICKDNTDIQEGKCTWLVVVALQRATPEQRKILEECYGVSEPEKVNRVKQLFTDLDLPNIYSIYEEETYNLLNVHIQQMSPGLPHSLFFNLLDRVYHRKS
ncbi:farnesyl pyrophosphate synthase [Monomorium pharaonis]|uniref:farnesyl pyrophosphate synthase n=1 Tax=Monomorium pharaonis TaxID=307658 RepID=UPI0017466E9D|nr:farnesyl pyrophosphate synthase [Monomorium pharaonis]